MPENPIETAANELKKWLEVLEKLLNKMESDKLAKDAAKLSADRHNEHMEALKDLKKEISKNPDSPAAKEALEKIDAAEKGLDENNPDVKKEISKNPDSPAAKEALGKIDAAEKGLDENNPDVKKEIGKNPDSPQANNDLNESHALQEDSSVSDEIAASGPKSGTRGRSQSLPERLDKKARSGSVHDSIQKEDGDLQVVKDHKAKQVQDLDLGNGQRARSQSLPAPSTALPGKI